MVLTDGKIVTNKQQIIMIMSEGNKLPALSLEVKSFMIPHDEIV